MTHVPHLTGTALLAEHGLTPEPAAPASELRFDDGAHFRIEIPSGEGPDVLRGVVDAAAARGVTVNRVSQGSGAMLQSEAELAEMARIGADNGIEVSLFVGPREEWDIGRRGRGAGGRRSHGPAARDQAAALRGRRHRAGGRAGHPRIPRSPTPDCFSWRASCRRAGAAAGLDRLEGLGRPRPVEPARASRCSSGSAARPSTCRRTSTLGQLAEMRAVSALPIDLYVETPDGMGGVVRGHEAADLITVAAPMYVKFGLRNSRPLYPSGVHLVSDATAIAREKVRRAQIALEWIERSGLELSQSKPGAPGLGVPEPAR